MNQIISIDYNFVFYLYISTGKFNHTLWLTVTRLENNFSKLKINTGMLILSLS